MASRQHAHRQRQLVLLPATLVVPRLGGAESMSKLCPGHLVMQSGERGKIAWWQGKKDSAKGRPREAT